MEERIIADTPAVKFFNAIKWEPLKTFKDSAVKAKMKNKAKRRSLSFQRFSGDVRCIFQ